MYINFTKASRSISVVAAIICIGGFASFLKSDSSTNKALALNIIIGSGAIAVGNQLLSKHYQSVGHDQVAPVIQGKDKQIFDANKEFDALKDKYSKQASALNEAKELASKQSSEIEAKNNAINILNSQIKVLQSELVSKSAEVERKLQEDDIRFTEMLAEFKQALAKDLSERIYQQYNYLQRSVEAKLKVEHWQCIRPQLEKFSKTFDRSYDDHCEMLQSITSLDGNWQAIANQVVDIYSRVSSELIALRVRYQNLLCIDERLRLDMALERLNASVAKDKAKDVLNQFNEASKANLEELLLKVDDNENSLQEMRSQIVDLIDHIDDKNLEIAKLNQQIAELNRPQKWYVATRDDLRIGNAIISYFEQLGIVLDRASSDYQKWQAVLSFHVDRNRRVILASELNEHSHKLQQLTHAIEPIGFNFDGESGLMLASVQLAKKPKKNTTLEEISKLWVPAAKFEATVKNWSRVRLTGGSESGKSPTAENLAVCILKNRPGVAKLFNPQHDSIKNYWTIPVEGTSHNDSEKAVKELAKKVDNRANSQESRSSFEMWLFDEIDSTFSHTHNKKASIADSVCFVIKQASHQNLGAIFIGQNANVTEYKGMSRSDWNSAVNVHIGNNAYDAITNSNQFTNEEQNRLKAIADKLTEFCTSKNDELQLDKTDPNAYRFALVIEPSKKPYFIELPAFGTYTYDQVAGVAEGVVSQPTVATANAESLVNSSVASNVVPGIVGSCPSCGSSNAKKNGRTKTTQKYQCKNCGQNYALPLN